MFPGHSSAPVCSACLSLPGLSVSAWQLLDSHINSRHGSPKLFADLRCDLCIVLPKVQAGHAVLQGFSRLSVSGFEVFHSPSPCFVPVLLKHHLTISLTAPEYGSCGICAARCAVSFPFAAFSSVESYIIALPFLTVIFCRDALPWADASA